MLGFLKALFLVLHFSDYILRSFLMLLAVILLSMLMILFSTLKCDQVYHLWQQVELACELESDLQDTGLLVLHLLPPFDPSLIVEMLPA